MDTPYVIHEDDEVHLVGHFDDSLDSYIGMVDDETTGGYGWSWISHGLGFSDWSRPYPTRDEAAAALYAVWDVQRMPK